MEPKANLENPVRFGVFEADMTSGELRKSGVRLRLSGQPFQVLAVLLRNPGNVVTREDLKQELWPDDTFVDFENGVNTAIRKIRRVLDDSADTPRYVETLPRRGYRFIGQVEGLPQDGIKGGQEGQGASLASQRGLRVQGTATQRAVPKDPLKHGTPWALAAVLAVALFASLYFKGTATVDRPVRKWSFAPEALGREVAVSPNGRHIAYRAGVDEPAIWVRDMDRMQPRRLPGTEGALGRHFWSPDSEWVAFWAGGELKRISRSGGLPIVVCALPGVKSGCWSPDGGTIIVSTSYTLFEVPAGGGKPTPIPTRLATEWGPLVKNPRFLPRPAPAGTLLYDVGVITRSEVWVANLETGNTAKLVEGAEPFYSPSGHILYQTTWQQPGLWALPFSLDTLEATGEPFPIAEGVGLASVSTDGTLVAVDSPSPQQQRLVLLDRRGAKIGAIGAAQRGILRLSVSPEGARIAVEGLERRSDAGDIWIHEVNRETKQRLTFDRTRDTFPSWSPDGQWIVYRSDREGQRDLWVKRANGQGEPRRLTNSEAGEFESTWAPDSRRLIYVALDGESMNLRLLTLDDRGRVEDDAPFLTTASNVTSPQISLNGEYVAYVSDETGDSEVYVQLFPQGSTPWRVSESGGEMPRWSRDSKELFYVEGNSLIVTSVSAGATYPTGSPVHLFDHPGFGSLFGASDVYNVLPDGRFAIVEDLNIEGQASKPSIRVIENWYEEFRDREQD